VPQLIAEFGAEIVEKHCPGMMKFYKDFSAKVHNKMATDPALSQVLAKIDNTKLEKKLQAKPPQLPTAPTNQWLDKSAGDVSLDGLMAKIEAEYKVRHGELNLVANTTVPFGPGSYKVKAGEEQAFNTKMAKVRAALQSSMDPGKLASEIGPDAIRSLVFETVGLVERAANDDAIEVAVAGNAGHWVRDSKIRLVDHKIDQGQRPAPVDLAEAVLLQAESNALAKLGNRDPNSVVDVNGEKHAALVKSLAADLAKKMKTLPADQLMDLVPLLANAIADSPKSPFSIKKKNLTGDPSHVSIDKASAKRAWLLKLKAL